MLYWLGIGLCIRIRLYNKWVIDSISESIFDKKNVEVAL